MRQALLAGLSVLLLSSAGWLVFYASLSRQDDAFLTPEVARDFDAQEVKPLPRAPAAPASAPAPQLASLPLRDAVASPSPLAAAKAPPATATVSAVAVAGHKLFQGLISSPIQFMAGKTHLGRPERFQAFLRDQRRVGRYLSHPLIRGVLDRPALVRILLSRPAVIQGFIASPAMQDGRAVAALAQSGLLKQLSQSPGVQAVLEDPVFMQQLVTNPQLMGWIARQPAATAALSQFGPTMAQAMGAQPRLRTRR